MAYGTWQPPAGFSQRHTLPERPAFTPMGDSGLGYNNRQQLTTQGGGQIGYGARQALDQYRNFTPTLAGSMGMGGGGRFSVPAAQPSSITEQGVYSPEQTAIARNQAVSAARRNADLRYSMKQFDRPGASRGAGQAAHALNDVAAANADAASAGEMIPLLDAITNARHRLATQTAGEDERLGLGNLSQRYSELASRQRQDQSQQIMNLLQALGV